MTPLALKLRSDERLALQVAGGNDAAFDAIYRRYEATLFGYCRSITRNADDAGDALQNAMLKALLALRREERSAPLRPWLFRIVHNEAVNQVTRKPLVAPPRPDYQHAAVAGADEQAAARERVAEIVDDLRELPLRQRAALVMRELGDLDYPEIALALDVTENNARQLVFTARAGLKDRQEGRGLSCDAVREMVLRSDARRLRRRAVRAHLRTCAGCQEFADPDLRRPLSRAAALVPLEWLARLLGGAGSAVGGSVAALGGGAVVKAAATAAVLTAGLGVADVAREHEASRRDAATISAVAPAAEAGTGIVAATEAVSARKGTDALLAVALTRAVARSTSGTAEPSAADEPEAGDERSPGASTPAQLDERYGRDAPNPPAGDRHEGRRGDRRATGDRDRDGGWAQPHEQRAPAPPQQSEPRQGASVGGAQQPQPLDREREPAAQP